MSLVVGAIHDGESITLVGDTKVTWDGDEHRTRHTYENALPKVVLLREDLAVGVTGQDPHRLICDLVAHRDETVDSILDYLTSQTDAAVVVAALRPARLWTVEDGTVDERTSIGRAWAGDQAAYEHFQARFSDWPDSTDIPFRLLSSMQWLTSFDAVPSVGGYTLRVAGTPTDGFRFVADAMIVAPWFLELNEVSISEEKLKFSAAVPSGGDSTGYRLYVFPGRGETRGALGLLIPEAHLGLLFEHAKPASATPIRTSSPQEFARISLEQNSQDLSTDFV